METNEWLYGELLDLLKQKEKEKDNFQQIELELPLIEYIEMPKEKNNDSEEIDSERGIIIIDF